MHPFEAVILRFVPDEAAGEALNVGVALRCPARGFFRVELADVWRRISDAFPEVHAPTIRSGFVRVRDALMKLDGAALLPGVATFEAELRAVVPSPDGFLKCSAPVHGETDDPDKTLQRLLARYVEQSIEGRRRRLTRKDEDVRAAFDRALTKRSAVQKAVFPTKLVASGLKEYELDVQVAWQNGLRNCVHPVSLDLLDVHDINNKAMQLAGRVQIVAPSTQDAHMVLLIAVPPVERGEARDAARLAIEGVKKVVQTEAEVYLEDESEQLLDRIERDVAAHTS